MTSFWQVNRKSYGYETLGLLAGDQIVMGIHHYQGPTEFITQGFLISVLRFWQNISDTFGIWFAAWLQIDACRLPCRNYRFACFFDNAHLLGLWFAIQHAGFSAAMWASPDSSFTYWTSLTYLLKCWTLPLISWFINRVNDWLPTVIRRW